YLQVGQKERAAALYTRIGALEPLIEIVRSCDRQNDQDEGIMLDAAACFIKHDHYMFAKEALTKAEDFENLISLHVKKSRLPDKPMKAVADVARQLTNLSAEQKLFKQAGMYS
ncbi:hypothetical protein Pmar_PMAR027142, partial [Perkinsus marinus ATCC 50983]